MSNTAPKVARLRAGRPHKPQSPALPPEFHWRGHDFTRIRVWVSTWSGDQFEIMTHSEFQTVKDICKRFGFSLVAHSDD